MKFLELGKKTKNELILHFKSIKRVRTAKFEDIEKIIGKARATIIYNHFNGGITPSDSKIQQ